MKDSDNFTAYNVPRQCQCLTVRWKRKTSHHSSSAHAVFYSFRLRLEPTAGCLSWFNDFLWYIISGYNTELDAKWAMAGIFFSTVTLLLCLEKKAIQKINYRLKKRKKKSSLRLLETDRTRTKKNVTETILKIFQFLLDWTFWVPKVTNISFLPTILMYHHENTIWEWILKMVTWSPEGKYFQLIFSIDLKFSPLIL